MTAKRKRLTAVFQAQAALKGDKSVNGIAGHSGAHPPTLVLGRLRPTIPAAFWLFSPSDAAPGRSAWSLIRQHAPV
jgi:hypothetical protein